MVINAAGEENYNSDSTMVVCNKWELVPEKDRDWVKCDTFQKLSRYFTDLKESQVHFMSIVQVCGLIMCSCVENQFFPCNRLLTERSFTCTEGCLFVLF